MTDSTSSTTGNDAHGAAARRSGAPSPDGGREVTGAFEREAYAAATSRGYGNAMGRGFELAMTLLVMVGIGLLVDAIFGTGPLFVIVLSVLGFSGITVKLWLGYDQEMRREEEGAIWNRHKEQAA